MIVQSLTATYRCRCGAQFCYLCGLRWRTCTCPQHTQAVHQQIRHGEEQWRHAEHQMRQAEHQRRQAEWRERFIQEADNVARLRRELAVPNPSEHYLRPQTEQERHEVEAIFRAFYSRPVMNFAQIEQSARRLMATPTGVRANAEVSQTIAAMRDAREAEQEFRTEIRLGNHGRAAQNALLADIDDPHRNQARYTLRSIEVTRQHIFSDWYRDRQLAQERLAQ